MRSDSYTMLVDLIELFPQKTSTHTVVVPSSHKFSAYVDSSFFASSYRLLGCQTILYCLENIYATIYKWQFSHMDI